MENQEQRKLDKIAAEAQAFLLNNQKKNAKMSETGSISSMSKGTVKADSVATTIKPGKKAPGT